MFSASSTSSQQVLRITTVNSSSLNNNNANLILRFMNQYQLDILCIQESHWDTSTFNKYASLFSNELIIFANNASIRE